MIIEQSLLYSKNNHFENSAELFDLFEYGINIMNDSIFNIDILIESTDNKFDITQIIHTIINTITNIITTIFNKFKELLIKMFSIGASFRAELKLYKEKIKNFNGSITLDDTYKFSNIFGEDINKYPNQTIIYNLEESLSQYMEDINHLASKKSAIEIQKDLEKYNLDVESEIGKFRASLINSSKVSLSDEEFNKECFKLFRDGKEATSTQTYSSIYSTVYEPYMNQKNTMDQFEKDKNRIESNFKNMKEFIDNKKITISTDYVNKENLEIILKSYAEARTNFVKIFKTNCQSAIYLYNMKLQAYKDFLVIAKKILVKTISTISTSK